MTRNFLNIVLVAFLIYLLYGLALGHNSLNYYFDMSRRIEEQQKQYSTLKAQTLVLERQVAFLKTKDLQNYEFLFKRDLDLIREDEVFFRIIDDRIPIIKAPEKTK